MNIKVLEIYQRQFITQFNSIGEWKRTTNVRIEKYTWNIANETADVFSYMLNELVTNIDKTDKDAKLIVSDSIPQQFYPAMVNIKTLPDAIDMVKRLMAMKKMATSKHTVTSSALTFMDISNNWNVSSAFDVLFMEWMEPIGKCK